MRIEQLEYIAAVTEHGSLRRAGERLHVSQPALSEAVAKLERELGVTLLDRRRSGARISRRGADLLQPMIDVLDAVERLKAAARTESPASRLVRLGTVSTATSTLLVPAVLACREAHPEVTVELVNAQQAQISEGISEGRLDLGLVNLFEGDDAPHDTTATELLRGTPVAVLPRDHPLSGHDAVSVADLRSADLVGMRPGYLMHRFTQRLFGGEPPRVSAVTDGAEMGKLMVAEGLGVTLLPDFSVVQDPLFRAGLITARPIAGISTRVSLVALRRVGDSSAATQRLLEALLAGAGTYRSPVAAPARAPKVTAAPRVTAVAATGS